MEIDNRARSVKQPSAERLGRPADHQGSLRHRHGYAGQPGPVQGPGHGRHACDGFAAAFSEACDWQDGLPIQGAWDDYGWTRHWDCPTHFEAIVIDKGSSVPSGTGEIGNGAGYAAAAIALQNALGKKVTRLPVFYRDPNRCTGHPQGAVDPAVPDPRSSRLTFY